MPAAPLRASRGPSTDAHQPINRRSLHLPFGRPLQAAADEQVGHNDIQQPSYRVGFYSVGMHFDAPKPETGGEGVRRIVLVETSTHKTPQIFLRQLARMRACPTPVACPTVRVAACVHVVPLGAIDEFCGDLVERVPG